MFDHVNDENFLLYCAHYYNNVACENVDEFYSDLARIKYIKRLLNKYIQGGEIKERLILNHLIILYNCFQKEALTTILCFRLNEYIPILKTFLSFLNYWPQQDIIGVGQRDNIIKVNEVTVDFNIVRLLQKI